MVLKDFFARHWPVYALGIVLLIVTDLLALLIPRAVGQAVDAIGTGVGSAADAMWLLAGVSVTMAALRFSYR